MMRCVLFDFFGTLVEYSASRTDQGYATSHRLLVEAGARLDYAAFLEVWSDEAVRFEDAAEASRREFSMPELVEAFLRRIDVASDAALVERFTRSYLGEWNKGVRYHDGLPKLLGRLRDGFTLGIVTNTHDPDLVPNHLADMGVRDHFDCLVTSVEFGRRKPDPAIFHEALAALGVPAAETLYVGDSHTADYLGARAAGIPCWLIDPRGDAPVPAADRLASLFEIERRVRVGDFPRRPPMLGDPC